MTEKRAQICTGTPLTNPGLPSSVLSDISLRWSPKRMHAVEKITCCNIYEDIWEGKQHFSYY